MTDENKAAQPGLEKLVADIVTLCNLAANSTWSLGSDSARTQAAAEFGRLQQDVLSRIRDLYAAKAAQPESKDAEMYQWLKERFVGYDFEWGEPSMIIAAFEVGDDFPCERNITAAISASIQAKGK